jgi:hypothetical protein
MIGNSNMRELASLAEILADLIRKIISGFSW